uniref:Tudor domain-containing protein 5 n=1 Tax=Biomphalaria glabrata TaxID=6526 RepID=A0A2C9KL44_BIOGL
MTDLNKKREEIKRQIRSLLESAPLGLTLHELKRDYKIFIGSQFPTRELGFNRDEDFLSAIDDVVHISWQGNQMVLQAVASKETKQLVKLINRQKIDPKKNWGVLKNARYDRNLVLAKPYSPKDYPPRNAGSDSMDWRASSLYNYPMPYDEKPRRKTSKKVAPSVSAFVRAQIHDLVRNSQDGVSLIYLRPLFRNTYGTTLEPQLMGFSSLEDMLSSMADTVQMKNYGSEVRVVSTIPPAPSNRSDIKSSVSQNTVASDNVKSNCDTKFKVESKVTKQDPKDQIHCNIPPAFQNYVRQVISNYPKGISSSRFPVEFKATHKLDMPLKTYGYNSVIDFISDLPHIVRMERPNPQGDWMLYPAEVKPDKKSEGKEEKQLADDTDLPPVEIDQLTKDTIVQVLSMHKDGIPLSKFQSVYKDMTGVALEVDKYCNGGIKQLLMSLPYVLISICPKDKYRVYLKDVVATRKFDKLSSIYQPLTNNEQSDDTPQLPIDVVGPGCYYKQQPLPAIDEEHQYINLFVSYIVTPALFWVQLRGTETTVALEDLMDDIEKIYESKKLSREYFMTPAIAKKGLLCAAIYPEDRYWYRAVIMDIKEPFYEVFYVDYGNTCSVTVSQLRLLKAKFLKLPAQAIQARLSHLHPVGEKWEPGARDRMLVLSKERPLCGLVTNIKDRVLSLCLVDTNDESKDVHINDVLTQEGYCTFIADDQFDLSPVQKNDNELIFGENVEPETKSTNRLYVRQVQMSDDIVMNLINLDGHPYFLSFEISKLFFKEDIIGSKLKRDNIDVKKIIVNKANYPDLFQELLLYDVANFTEKCEMLSLFSLSAFPMILKLYGKGEIFDDMRETAQELLNWFDPDDPYWKGEGDTESSSSTTQDDQDSMSTSGGKPTMDELSMALQTLNMQRKRILYKMMSGSQVRDSVTELDDVETKIKKVEDFIKKLESDSGLTHSTSDSPDMLNYQNVMGQDLSAAKTTQKVAPILQSQLENTLLQSSLPSISDTAMLNRVLQEQAALRSNSSVNPSVNPGLMNQQLLATLQQQMLQSQLQHSALEQSFGLPSSHSSVLSSLAPTLLQASGNSFSFTPSEQLQQNTWLLQNQQQQMNAFTSALASLQLGSAASSSNLSDLLSANPSNFQPSAGAPGYNTCLQNTTVSASAPGLTPLQRSRLLQIQQLQNLAAQSNITTSH